MSEKELAKAVYGKMMEKDAFSQWLGISAEAHAAGYCLLRMSVRPEMLNGFGIVHGGVTFSLADSALAFAANAGNTLSVTLDGHISYPGPARPGDTLWAEAREISATKKTAFYDVAVRNAEGETLALYRGTVYRTRARVLTPDPQ